MVVFLAAWLVCSLEDIDGENEVRERLVYAFSPGGVISTEELIVGRLRTLNTEQRVVVRSLLTEFAQRERSAFIRKHAVDAVKLIDSST